MKSPEPIAAIRDVISHWHRLSDLSGFAVKRHGFGDSDGGFGVTYPGDLDEYDREVEKIDLPANHVQIYGFWGPPDGYELIVSELLYLETLAEVLREQGYLEDAGWVRRTIKRIFGQHDE